jgi:beta-glucanase (GH16 family)
MVASDWWVHQFAFSKENVVVVGKDLELRQRAGKSGEVGWTKSAIGAVTVQVAMSLIHLVLGVIYCGMFLYGSDASEIDSEIVHDPNTNTWRREYRIHVAGGATKFFVRDTLDPSGFHIERIDYQPGQYVKWYVDGELRCTATPADLEGGPNGFPSGPMEMLADCWGGGWTEGYGGEDATLTLHGFKIQAL